MYILIYNYVMCTSQKLQKYNILDFLDRLSAARSLGLAGGPLGRLRLPLLAE